MRVFNAKCANFHEYFGAGSLQPTLIIRMERGVNATKESSVPKLTGCGAMRALRPELVARTDAKNAVKYIMYEKPAQ